VGLTHFRISGLRLSSILIFALGTAGTSPTTRARRIRRSRPKRDPITHQAYSAIHVGAAVTVINAVAVAHIEATLATIPPDRVLDEPGEGLRKARIELPGIDPLGYGLNNVGAAAVSIAGRAIRVVRVKPMQNAGPVQKIMNQCVDGDQPAADLGPEAHFLGSAEQEARQGHGEDLVRANASSS
jgi:hypothetical protein